MNKKIIIGNWKMNLSPSSSIKLIKDLNTRIKKEDIKNVDIIICPSYVFLEKIDKTITKDIKLGSQNINWEKSGAYTGEISIKMIKNIGCKYAIIGHSERRIHLNETNEMVNKKIIACLKNNIIPILCIGEDLQERKTNKTNIKIINQVVSALSGVRKEDVKKIIFAYEPIWAIGTKKPATPADAEEVAIYIKKLIGKYKKYKVYKNIKVIYGGSVDQKNIRSFIDMNNIDGSLVGGESLKAAAFANIIKNSYK